MDSRLITVIIPVYKVEDCLDRCIESIVNQTYKNIEIILVDDGSPDNCPEICDDWALKDSRIKVIHKKNGGLSSARNAAIKIAKGEYYLLVDSDDYIVDDAIERLNAITNNEDIIVGEALICKGDKQIHRIHTNLDENHIYTGQEYAITAIRVGEWFAAACYSMYRRDFIIENELFFKEGILHEDIEYLPRLCLAAQQVRYIHYEFYRYMIRSGSICETQTEKHLSDLFTTYSEWKILADSIQEPNTKKAYCGALCKAVIYTCRTYRCKKKVLPKGIDNSYLIKNALNIKEKIKTIAFVLFRGFYVRL